jgi:hypothetical protein
VGCEYRLSIKASTKDALSDAMLAIRRLEGESIVAERLEFRRDARNAMPDATVILEDSQIYFCDHGGSGRDYLGKVVEILVSRFGSVIVEEYE